MRLLTVLEIATNHPSNTLVEAVQDKETGKWTSVLYLMKDGEIHKELTSFKDFPFDDKEKATTSMNELINKCVDYARIK